MNFETEKKIKPVSGFVGIISFVLMLLISVAGVVCGAIMIDSEIMPPLAITTMVVGIVLACVCWVPLLGIKLINPNEALVLALFGKYYGTITDPGFYTVNPFCNSLGPKDKESEGKDLAKGVSGITINASLASPNKKVSLKVNSWDNGVQKVNDSLGNPLTLSSIVFWRVVNPTKAVINIDNYKTYLSSQTDSVIRNIARLHPYDFAESEDKIELSLRSSSMEIAEEMKAELQEKVDNAGIEIVEVKLNQIAYAPEIAAVMLQRQQASAIIAARKKIVEGAVGMVQMALKDLSENQVIEFDEDKKAQMVSNLLVVLCGNKDAQPIVNSGSIY